MTNSRKQYDRLRALRWCGIDRSTWDRAKGKYGWDYSIAEVGYKYHWNDIQAAIGLAQLHRLDEMNDARKEIAQYYNEHLRDCKLIRLPEPDESSTWHLYTIRVPYYLRNNLIRALLDRDISAGVHYKPLSHYAMFSGDVPVTESEWRCLVSLPIFYGLTVDQLEFIVNTIKTYIVGVG